MGLCQRRGLPESRHQCRHCDMPKQDKIFTEIYDQYIDKLYRFIFLKVSSQETAQDLCSEVFLRYWKSMDLGTEIENPRAFLYQIARNLVIDHYREKGQAQLVSLEKTKLEDPDVDLEKQARLTSDVKQIEMALAGLKQDYQDALIWYYLDDLPISEIAELMNKTENNVRVIIHRALNELRRKL